MCYLLQINRRQIMWAIFVYHTSSPSPWCCHFASMPLTFIRNRLSVFYLFFFVPSDRRIKRWISGCSLDHTTGKNQNCVAGDMLQKGQNEVFQLQHGRALSLFNHFCHLSIIFSTSLSPHLLHPFFSPSSPSLSLLLKPSFCPFRTWLASSQS